MQPNNYLSELMLEIEELSFKKNPQNNLKALVLIIDDNISNLKVLGNILRTNGYQIAIADSGEKALSILTEISPDLILLDIQMPHMDGFEVCQKIKDMDRVNEIPIIFITARVEKEDIIKGFEVGAVDYITKPFDGAELLARIKTHVILKNARDIIIDKNIELEKSRNIAENATKIKDKFVGLVAHDLRSPLAGLLSALAFIKEQNNAPLIEKFLTASETTVQNMLQLIEDLLNLNRIQRGEVILKQEFYQIKSLIDWVIEDFKILADAKNIKILNDVSMNVRLFVDKILFKELIANLLSNSIKFTNPNGVVKIYISSNNIICVEDSGVGIEKNFLLNIFNSAVKTVSKGTKGEKGNGIGLPFCKEIVSLQNGKIWISSTENVGTLVHVEFPNIKPKAIILDNNNTENSALLSLFQQLDVDTVFCNSKTDMFLALANEPQAQLLIIKQNIVGSSGLDLINLIKKEIKYRSIPLILLTDDKSKEIKVQAFQAGVQDVLLLPFEISEMFPRIQRLLLSQN